MATHVFASAVFGLNTDEVWSVLRDFTFPASSFEGVESCEMVGGVSPFSVGAVRHVRWCSGEEQRHRLLLLSDMHRTISWEVVWSNHPTEFSACISTLTCRRITESNSTLISWESDFSADAAPEVITFYTQAHQQNLSDLRMYLQNLHGR